MEYNSGRPKMIIPEYGRHIQKMIDHATGLESKEERNKCAQSIIDVMGQLNPHLRDVADFKHKLWDHLFIMSNFNLDVDSPYDKPSAEILNEKPEQVDYPSGNIRFKHYGKIINDLIQKACEYEEGDEKKALTESIANLMKRMYLTWNNKTISDEVIIKDLETLSKGNLKLDEGFEFDQHAEVVNRNQNRPHRRKSGGKHRQNNRGKKRN